jgi:hypothetical protein
MKSGNPLHQVRGKSHEKKEKHAAMSREPLTDILQVLKRFVHKRRFGLNRLRLQSLFPLQEITQHNISSVFVLSTSHQVQYIL